MESLFQLVGFLTSGGSLDRRSMLKGTIAAASLSGLLGGTSAIGQSALDRPRAVGSTQTNLGKWHDRQVGFQLAGEQFTVPELVELGIAAERAGFDMLAASDHLQPWQSNQAHSGQAWIMLSAIGQHTSHIRMGTTVTCPTFRYNTAVVAQAFASLNSLCPGRIFLGIGSGEALNEEAAVGYWPKWDERSERLVEAAEIIRQLWTGQQLDLSAGHYPINAKLYDPPTNPIPILMAANGQKAMKRAARHADGVITDPKTWKENRSEFEREARGVGKDPSIMPIFIEQYAVVGDKADLGYAAELWRFGPKAWKPYYNLRDPKTIEQRADEEIPLEKVYADWAIGTDPKIHIDALSELFASGATEVHIHSGQRDQKRVIEFYGKQVLPRVRDSSERQSAA